MTGKVVSLSAARKARARSHSRQQADTNAARYGRSKAERIAEDQAQTRTEADLDNHKCPPE
ncbi:MAG TPA: DUF4169 family protein [Roseibacterium sp.]|nr:DUF4169 family protein [Roseibacterium sp.]